MMTFFLLVILVVLLIEVFILRGRVGRLEKFRDGLVAGIGSTVPPAGAETAGEARTDTAPARVAAAGQGVSLPKDKPLAMPVAPDKEPAMPLSRAPRFSQPSESSLNNGLAALTAFLRVFCTTGNLVLKAGVIILFFGVAFLLKYAAEHSLIPLELRLAGVGLGGVAVLLAGWFLTKKQPAYGLVLQGGGVGILYLTVFASSRLYGLLPHSLSLMLMIGLVVLSCILAVLQDSKALAVFGVSGGFLAPVLMASGSGSHVMLFSYYALLNCGIAGISWFRAWRELNLAGFVFTFGLSALWGYGYYQPAYFFSTEPFLLLFFLIYVTISVLFAHRQPVQLKGFIDGPLVFGLPIVAFGMQASLVENMEYGVAISALALGLFYVLLARLLWKRLVEGMRMLTEAFLALGVVFGSLAIPFALDGSWTSSAWALEGAAMVWVGVRQQRVLARLFGILLQFGAAVSLLLAETYVPADAWLFVNRLTMSCLFIAIGGLVSSFFLCRHREGLRGWEALFPMVLLTWAVLWWVLAGVRDIVLHSSSPETATLLLLFFGATALGFCLIAGKTGWQELRFPLLGYLPCIIAVTVDSWYGGRYLLEGWAVPAWTFTFFVQYLVLKRFEDAWPKGISPWYHLLTLWLLMFILTDDAALVVDRLIAGAEVWPFVCWALVPGCCLLLLLHFGEKLQWPVVKYADHYLDIGVIVPLSFLVAWSVVSNFMVGTPTPLRYIFLINPLAVTQIFVFIVILSWLLKNREQSQLLSGRLSVKLSLVAAPVLLGSLVFLWLNGVTARLVNLFFDVPFRIASLFDSAIFQSAISLLWAVVALAVTVWATRRQYRRLWFAGASLLGCVVAKLFVIDLAGTGTVARIVSFIAVGLLMLVIGYFSPLPPREEERQA